MESHKSYPTYWQSIPLLLSMFLWGIPIGLITYFLPLPKDLSISILYLGSMLGAVVTGLHLRENWKINFTSVPTLIIATAFFSILSLQILIEPFASIFPPPDYLIDLANSLKTKPVLGFFTIVLLGPILEELLFRGVILDGFLKNYKPTHAILVSALLFALLHGNLAQGIGAFMSGVVIGWVYWRTKSIMPCIVLHVLNNSIAFMGTQFIATEDLNKGTQDLIGNNIMYATIYVSAICIAASSLWILNKKIFNTGPLPPQIPQT